MLIEHLGCARSVVIVPEAPRMVVVEDTRIVMALAEALVSQAPSVLARWQEREAKRYLTVRVRALSEETGLVARRLSFRRQRSRWGSCNAHGDVSLNLSLIELAPELIDYVILHELTHTKHMNHSRAFWCALERCCSGARRLDKVLRTIALTREGR